MTGNRRHFLYVSVFIIIGALVTFFLLTAIYQLPLAASEEAVEIDRLMQVHFALISVLFSLIVVFMLYAIIVFRRRPGEDDVGVHFEGNTALEIAWTVIPLITVIVIGIWGAVILNDITRAEASEMQVDVLGEQWNWNFRYPNYEEVGVCRELVLPVNRPVRLEMTSRDVIHSFWVVEFRVKQDLVPGHTTILRFTPTEEGDYKVRCAEICGLGHSEMRADVRVVSEPEFEAWVSSQATAEDGPPPGPPPGTPPAPLPGEPPGASPEGSQQVKRCFTPSSH
ncbi:MAG: cytochrome c oxidase subunit II [Candidatus Promineifilaceae bacterium]